MGLLGVTRVRPCEASGQQPLPHSGIPRRKEGPVVRGGRTPTGDTWPLHSVLTVTQGHPFLQRAAMVQADD